MRSIRSLSLPVRHHPFLSPALTSIPFRSAHLASYPQRTQYRLGTFIQTYIQLAGGRAASEARIGGEGAPTLK